MSATTAGALTQTSPRAPLEANLSAARSWGGRVLSGLRRRVVYAWSRSGLGNHRQAPVEAAYQWLVGCSGRDGVPAPGQTTGCPGLTGAAMETMVRLGARDVACRWAAWLLSIQRPDGSFPVPDEIPEAVRETRRIRPLSLWERVRVRAMRRRGESLNGPVSPCPHPLPLSQTGEGGVPDSLSVFHTAQAARGLLALEPTLPDVRLAAIAACRYLASRIGEDGRLATMTAATAEARSLPLSRVALGSLPPLLEAARRFDRPDWEAAVRRAVACQHRTAGQDRLAWPTEALAWWVEALIDLGYHQAAAQAMDLPARLQRRGGGVPAWPGAGWVSSAGMAHLAACWYRLSAQIAQARQRADRAMRYLGRRQGRSGGFAGGWGRGAGSHAHVESAWTARHYLDAAVLQVQTAFDAQPAAAQAAAACAGVPEWIDPADGRVQAVRRWMSLLPPRPRVADVGCGRGRVLRHLGDWFPAARLTGIDVSAVMLAELPQYAAAVRASMLSIPVRDGWFDGAFAVESLEHSLLPERAIAELCRIVRPGGRVLVIDKHRARQGLSLCEPWERWFTPEDLAAWLGRYCDEVTVEPVSHLEGRPGNGLFLAARGRRRGRQSECAP